MKYYILYKITNRLNNKFYIGRHITNKLDDDYFGSGRELKKAIAEDGIENFVFEPLIYLHNRKELVELEHCVVDKEFVLRDETYNVMVGGEHWQSMPGENNPFYGKTHSDEMRERWKKTRKGRRLTEDWKNNISKGLILRHMQDEQLSLKTAKVKVLNESTGEIEEISKLTYVENKDSYTLLSSMPWIRCINIDTLRIKRFKIVPKEKWIELEKADEKLLASLREAKRDRSRRNRPDHTGWKWYHDADGREIFCHPDKVPNGFILGRKSTLNVGRKYSQDTIEKMRQAQRGKKCKPAAREKIRQSMEGSVFWNNGVVNTRSKECPGPEWKRGVL